MTLAEKRHFPGIVIHFKKRLLEIAEKAKDIPQIQIWTESLFFLDNFDMKYYRILRKFWPPDTWQNKCGEIINKIKTPKAAGSLNNAQALANVFVEEGYLERLLTLLKINTQYFSFVDSNAHHLAGKYPVDLIGLYETGIRVVAETAGKSAYKEVLRYLKKIEKFQGGVFVANKLVMEFREKYRNRKAMMALLDKYFK